ncbi:MAG: AMP-binding protein [candidate division Zixibacteria bacterium]|nr:AMP-binding protein [candidate division Zixibacteria bacterium]
MIELKKNLTINNKFLEKQELKKFCNSELKKDNISDWEISLYNFILEWIGDDNSIKVKTSGSTGKPKIIKLEKEKMVGSAIMTGKFLKLKEGDKALLCLSTKFIAGKMMVVRAFTLSLDLITVEPAGNPLQKIDSKFDFAAMIPAQVFNVFLEKDGTKKLNNIKNLIIGGGPVHQNLEQKISLLKNKTHLTYGMTETITHIAMRKLNDANKEKSFKCLPEIKIGIDNRDCLVIKAPALFAGELKTNDVAEISGKNKFIITGRYDNVINSGGIKIFPEDIERKIEKLISEKFFISSLPDTKFGEKIILLIEGKAKNKTEINKLFNSLKKILKPHEVPKEIYFVDEFLFTANGKLDRRRTIKQIEHRLR